MYSFEFDKPETWSIGKKTGFLGIVLLVFGPIILVFIDSIFRSYSVFVAAITIILMVFLLYTKYNIFMEKEKTRIRINNFILVIWGAWQFFSYVRLAAYYMTYPSPHIPYTMISGLWLTAIGFLLCMVAGIMEWRYPEAMGPNVLFGGKTAPKRPVDKEYRPEVRATHSTSKGGAVSVNPNIKGQGEMKPKSSDAPPSLIFTNNGNRESANEEEKILMRWARHIGADGKAYEQCMRCGKYGFITARESQGSMLFSCPSCGSNFKLKK